MLEITTEEKNHIANNIIKPLKLEDFDIAIEKYYWHYKNEIYDTDIIFNFLTDKLKIGQDRSNEVIHQFKQIKSSPIEEVTGSLISAKTIEETEVTKQSEKEEALIKPLRTMKADVDKVHGYGAYRELYPDATAEPVHQSNQQETLARLPVAPLPSYGQEESK